MVYKAMIVDGLSERKLNRKWNKNLGNLRRLSGVLRRQRDDFQSSSQGYRRNSSRKHWYPMPQRGSGDCSSEKAISLQVPLSQFLVT